MAPKTIEAPDIFFAPGQPFLPIHDLFLEPAIFPAYLLMQRFRLLEAGASRV